MPLLYPKTREEWLDLRSQHISSTESSALFGMNPYKTAFELAVLKKNGDEPWDGNERMTWGLRLERAIAEGIAADYGLKVRQLKAYVSRMPEYRIGASLDFEIIGLKQGYEGLENDLRNLYRQHGPGVLEIKNVDGWVFKQEWDEVGKLFEAPPHIELQVQHQLECIERNWAVIGILVGGNRQVTIIRMRDREVGAAIRAKVADFYKKLQRGEMPPVNLPQDAYAIRALYGHAEPGSVLDCQTTDNPEIHALVAEHQAASEAKSAAEKHHKTTAAKLLMSIGTAEKVLFSDYSVSAGMVAPAHIEAYERAGYRNLRVYKRKEKEPQT